MLAKFISTCFDSNDFDCSLADLRLHSKHIVQNMQITTLPIPITTTKIGISMFNNDNESSLSLSPHIVLGLPVHQMQQQKQS